MLRVMLIERNRVIREMLRENLQKYFPSIIITDAVNGKGALSSIQEVSPHLIFISLQLPEMSGLELIQKIKKDFPNIQIAILTSYDMPEYRQAVLQAGADRFFVKEAFAWEEAKSFIQSILFRKRVWQKIHRGLEAAEPFLNGGGDCPAGKLRKN